jgi:phosphoesterase RecJ-like protein
VNYSNIKSVFERPKKVAITTHKSPDGDAIGSSMALGVVLRKLRNSVSVIVPDSFPQFLNWMDPESTILIDDQSPIECGLAISEADVVFSLDYNTLSRIGNVAPKIEASKAYKILIDHHLFPDSGFDEVLSDTSASSTAELIYDFICQMGWGEYIDKGVSECIYTGIMTDTGSFRFSSTKASTHRIAADLMDKGLVPSDVHQRIYDTNSFSRMKLIGHALSSNLILHKSGKAAIISLSLKEKNKFGYKKGDTEGLVNYGLSIEGVEIAMFLSEELDMVKFSFRSKGNVDVNEIARANFNGGGHRNAAGGRLDCDLDGAMQKLNEVLNELFI